MLLHDLYFCVFTHFHAFGADFDARTISKRRPLEIWVLSLVSCWVVFGCADAIRVVTYDDRSLPASWTYFCHSFFV